MSEARVVVLGERGGFEGRNGGLGLKDLWWGKLERNRGRAQSSISKQAAASSADALFFLLRGSGGGGR